MAAHVAQVGHPAYRPPAVRARHSRREAAGEQLLTAVLDAVPAMAVYAAVRLTGLLVLWSACLATGADLGERLMRYDALWLLQVSQDGYDTEIRYDAGGRPQILNAAFFPLLPMLVRAIGTLTGLSAPAAGYVVVAVGGLAAAAGIDRVGRLLAGRRSTHGHERRTGLVLVALWASWPHAVVLTMVYTEALFVALAAWALLCVLTGRWWAAGVLALLAGATRPTGTALAAAVCLAAAVEVARRWRGTHPAGARGVAAPLAAALLAPAGFGAYWWWLGRRMGRPDAWFHVQRVAWGSTFDGGRYQWDETVRAFTGQVPAVLVGCAVVVLVCVVLLGVLAAWRVPLPVLAYSALVVLAAVGSAGYSQSKPRFLLAAFPLLLPPARALAAGPARPVVLGLGAAAVLSAWYGAHLLLVWPLSP
jgi:hypothetical protein